MKMFRRLYWVAEQIGGNGSTKVTGVYTSIQDLISKGLHWCEGSGSLNRIRLTLVKPDSFNCPLGQWESPKFDGMFDTLAQFVEDGEYGRDEVEFLRAELYAFLEGKTAKAS